MQSFEEVSTEVLVSGVIVHRCKLCRGCKICELACSAYHEGICSSYLSRIHISADDLNLEFSAEVCAQCKYPSCYFACPQKDVALCIDNVTGVRYINEDECTGCGDCAAACPLPNPPIWQRKVGGSEVFFKCDLCRGRQKGPICIEMCPRNALAFVNRGDESE